MTLFDSMLRDLKSRLRDLCAGAADGYPQLREFSNSDGDGFAVYFVPLELVPAINALISMIAGVPGTSTEEVVIAAPTPPDFDPTVN